MANDDIPVYKIRIEKEEWQALSQPKKVKLRELMLEHTGVDIIEQIDKGGNGDE